MLIGGSTLALYLMPYEELLAVRARRREGRPWAEDYPTDGDVVISGVVLDARAPPATPDAPWGPLQIRELRTGLAIGGIGFKGAPDTNGAVEIGYGVAESRRRCGVATEAVRLIAALARARGVGALLAETAHDNVASQRVVERAGFVRTDRRADHVWWRLEL